MKMIVEGPELTLIRQQLKGTLLTPADANYEHYRLGWNRAVQQYPAYLLLAQDADDVVQGVQFANEAGLGIAVQSTGHGQQQVADGHLLILTSALQQVTVTAESRQVRVEAGALWHQVVTAAAPYGLAPLLGSSPYVGVVGYTLGGGIGWLVRPYGLAVDSVRAVEIVTADGVLRRATATEHPDLFWAVRGGGGTFGVVTALELELYPVSTIYGGTLTYSVDNARDALRFYREWVQTLPDGFTTSFIIFKFPNYPGIPEAMRGKMEIEIKGVYTGGAADGEAYLRPWLEWRAPTHNSFHMMPFTEIGTVSNDPVDPSPGYVSNEMFRTLSDEMIEELLQYALNPASPLVLVELRHLEGAVAHAEANSTAFSHRDAAFMLRMGGPTPTSEHKTAMQVYLQEVKQALTPYRHGGVYLNFMGEGEAEARVADAFVPEVYQRLVNIKQFYDPDNHFRFAYQLTQK